jgi:hypothetical protein
VIFKIQILIMESSKVSKYANHYGKRYVAVPPAVGFLRRPRNAYAGEPTIMVKMPTESMHSPTDKPTAGNPAVPVSRATRQALDYYARLRNENPAL